MDWSDTITANDKSQGQTENVREKKIHNCSKKELPGSTHLPLSTSKENVLQRRAII